VLLFQFLELELGVIHKMENVRSHEICPIEIRKAKIMELPQVHRMLWRNFEWDSRRLVFFLGKSLLQRGRHTYVCLVDDGIVGFAIVIEQRHGNAVGWYLALLIVGESYRRKGYGRQLLRFVESEARRHGINRIHLTVDDSNPAVQLYESEGFCARGHRTVFEKPLGEQKVGDGKN